MKLKFNQNKFSQGSHEQIELYNLNVGRGLGPQNEGSMVIIQVEDIYERPFKMVLAPPRGERDRGRNESVEEGSIILGK